MRKWIRLVSAWKQSGHVHRLKIDEGRSIPCMRKWIRLVSAWKQSG